MAQPHYVASANEFPCELKIAHGVTKVQFAQDTSTRVLGVSSWDGFVKIINETNPNSPVELRNQYHTQPVLSFTFMGSSDYLVSGDTDGNVKAYDVEHGRDKSMGKHEDAVRCIEFSPTMRLALSGGWDKLVKLWDVRTSMPVHACVVDDKVYALATVDFKAVVGTSNRQIYVYDIRSMRTPIQLRDSPLKYQTRAIACFPTGDGFVMSSIEGRVAVEYFDQDQEVQKGKYAFKCHRAKEESTEVIYPVNSIAFHPRYQSFATGGSDGIVNVWDPVNRKRLIQLRKFNSSVVSIDFSSDGELIALATTYLYESDKPPVPIPEPEVMVRKVTDFEVKPK